MQLSPYLYFNGQCEEAFRFYEQCLHAKIVTMNTYAESPMADQVPAEWRDKILHATLTVDDKMLSGCDSPAGRYEKPKGFSVTLGIEDPADAKRVFEALAENGVVIMPLQNTFWTNGFGMLVDKFGVPWMINCEQHA